MNQNTIWEHFSALPPEAQQEVIDFIAFLQTRHRPHHLRKAAKPTRLAEDTFIGMWRNRDDLRDSTNWVRETRTQEWGE